MASTGSVNLDWIRCGRKVMYRTRKVARDTATRLSRKHNGRRYRAYPCTICGGFHLATEKAQK